MSKIQVNIIERQLILDGIINSMIITKDEDTREQLAFLWKKIAKMEKTVI
jgi:hypothetical protein